jgi:hypothetical protein
MTRDLARSDSRVRAKMPCPEVCAPFAGFATGTPVADDRVRLPDMPGMGFAAKNDLGCAPGVLTAPWMTSRRAWRRGIPAFRASSAASSAAS